MLDHPLVLFVNREDCYAQQSENGYNRMSEPVTKQLLEKHLNGEITIGMYQLHPDNNMVQWICWDFDNNTKEDFNNACKLFKSLQQEFNPILENSGGGEYKCHVWIFIKTIDAASAKYFAEDFCKQNNVIPHEIFPKQTEITEERPYGNMVKLPLGIHRKSKNKSFLYNPETHEPLSFEDSLKLLEKRSCQEMDTIPKVIIKEEPIKKEKPEHLALKIEPCPALQKLLDTGVPAGERNKARQIIATFYLQQGLSNSEILDILYEFNEKCKEPIQGWKIDNDFKEVLKRKDEYLVGCKSFEKWCDVNKNKCEFIKNFKELIAAPTTDEEKTEEDWQKEIKDKIEHYINPMNLAIQLLPLQPYFYDRNKIWWMWDKEGLYWKIVDETDIMNQVDNALVNPTGTTNSQLRNEIIESMKRYGRKKIPKETKKTWIQFGSKIIDIETEEEIEPTPELFTTNPIPWELGESEDTPTMDKLFEEWVGKDYKDTLYEIISYNTLPDYPIHRIFCLDGGGCNGKGRYLELNRIFLGKANTCSSGLDLLTTNRFESSKLFKKLLCTMGETNFETLSKTDTLKRLTGQDEIGFEFKRKNGFTDVNYAKIMIATNSLPATTDKTIGFYRRWLIVPFPNIFPEGADILKTIPEVEYNNLARKCVGILKELLKRGSFTNEGEIEDRMRRYEAASNPVDTFIEENCVKDDDADITFADFQSKFKKYLAKNKKRKLSSKRTSQLLDLCGYNVDRLNKKKYDIKKDEEVYTTAYCVIGLKWKDEQGGKQMSTDEYV